MGSRLLALLALLGGCGRVGFDSVAARADGGTGDAGDAGPISGLVAYYPMEEDSTTLSLADVTGHGNDAVCSSPPCASTIAGHTGNAMYFAGNAFQVPNSAQFALTSGFTIVIWALWSGTTPGTLVSKPKAAGIGASFELAGFSNDFWFCTDSDPGPGTESCIALAYPLPTHWVQIAATWDGVTKNLYFDGVLVGTAAPETTVYDGSELWIGADEEDGIVQAMYAGALDELRIYDHALTQAEIDQLRAL